MMVIVEVEAFGAIASLTKSWIGRMELNVTPSESTGDPLPNEQLKTIHKMLWRGITAARSQLSPSDGCPEAFMLQHAIDSIVPQKGLKVRVVKRGDEIPGRIY